MPPSAPKTCAEHSAIAKAVEDHGHTLYGNGQEGLVTIVTKTAERVKLLLWLCGVIVGAVIVQIVATLSTRGGS